MFGSTFRSMVIASLLCLAGTAQAGFTTYTDKAAFLAALSAPATDTFNDLPLAMVASPLSRAATIAPYSYTATATNGFFPGGAPADVWLRPSAATDEITITNIPTDVRGIGGYFFGTDNLGNLQSGGDLIVQANAGGGGLGVGVLGATTSSFMGFVSDGPIDSFAIRMSGSQTLPGTYWATANDLIFAVASTTPVQVKAVSRKSHGAATFDLPLVP